MTENITRERIEEELFTVQKGDQVTTYSLSSEKTQAANVNYELHSSNGPKDLSSVSIVVKKEDLPDHLKPGVDITIIDSVKSGTGREKREFYKHILKPIFNELEIKHSFLETTSAETITKFAKSLDLTRDHTIILLSGDTSAVELINGLPSDPKIEHLKNINLLIIPQGTGNGLVYSAGITSEANAVQKIFSKEKSRLPLYQAEFPEGSYATHLPQGTASVDKLFFTIVVSWGSHAQMVYRAESPELRKLGTERFKVAVYQIFKEELKYNAEILILENGIERKFSQSSLHNYSSILAAPRLEKSYVISPDSNLKKDELHLLDFGDIPKEEFMALLMEPYKGRAHVDHEDVIYESFHPNTEIILKLGEEDEERSIICVDGISIKIKNPKNKRITVRFVQPGDLGYNLNLIGLQ